MVCFLTPFPPPRYDYNLAIWESMDLQSAEWFLASFQFLITNLFLWLFFAIVFDSYSAARIGSEYVHENNALTDLVQGARSMPDRMRSLMRQSVRGGGGVLGGSSQEQGVAAGGASPIPLRSPRGWLMMTWVWFVGEPDDGKSSSSGRSRSASSSSSRGGDSGDTVLRSGPMLLLLLDHPSMLGQRLVTARTSAAERAHAMLRAGAYVHWYARFGIDAGHIEVAVERVAEVADAYAAVAPAARR